MLHWHYANKCRNCECLMPIACCRSSGLLKYVVITYEFKDEENELLGQI